MRSPLVLLVEDEPLLRELIVCILEDIGADVVAVDTADLGAQLLPDRQWNLLITDVQTPGATDGIHLAWAAFQKLPDLPIVVTSGFIGRTDQLLPPAAVFIAKPWTVNRFITEVSSRLWKPE